MPGCVGTIRRCLTVRNDLARGMLAEMAGSFILVLIIDGGLAQGVVGGWTAATPISTALSTGMGVAFGIYTSWGVSGGHVNPAITLGLASAGKFAWRKAPLWIVAQILGSFAGAAVVFALYYPAIDEFDGGNRTIFGPTGTGVVFSAYPQPYYGIWMGVAEQIVNTGILLQCAMSFLDDRNCRVPRGTEPLVIGLCVTVLLLSWGHNGGAPMNPARDVTGRLLTWLVGYGNDVWMPRGMHWWWVATFVPLIGAICGANFYVIFVEMHHPKNNDDDYQQIQHDSTVENTELTSNSSPVRRTNDGHFNLHHRQISTSV